MADLTAAVGDSGATEVDLEGEEFTATESSPRSASTSSEVGASIGKSSAVPVNISQSILEGGRERGLESRVDLLEQVW